jgi:hypothetical protein
MRDKRLAADDLLAELLFRTLVSGVGAMSGPTMFRMPAYDPVAIAVMGCGILLAAALVLPF